MDVETLAGEPQAAVNGGGRRPNADQISDRGQGIETNGDFRGRVREFASSILRIMVRRSPRRAIAGALARLSSLAATADFPRPETLAAFAEHLPQDWIERALQATGTATLRKRRLPAEQVVWLVLGIALIRDRWIVEVVDKLDLALPGAGNAPVAPSAVAQARARLGQESMAWLFSHASQHWAPEFAPGWSLT
jgi:hypothetical protein